MIHRLIQIRSQSDPRRDPIIERWKRNCALLMNFKTYSTEALKTQSKPTQQLSKFDIRRNLLQAHVDGAILGQSPTQLYTYEVFLWRTPSFLRRTNGTWRSSMPLTRTGLMRTVWPSMSPTVCGTAAQRPPAHHAGRLARRSRVSGAPRRPPAAHGALRLFDGL